MTRSLPWNAWLLACIQPFVLSVGSLNVFLGGIVGAELQDSASLSTLPVTALIVGVFINAFPASKIQATIGRKNAFVIAAIISSISALGAAWAIELGSFWGFTASAFLLGTQLAFVGQYRFAAIESCKDSSLHANVVSLVLVGGIAAAWIGPELLNIGSLVGYFDSEFANAYLSLALLEITGALLLFLFMRSIPSTETNKKTESDSQLSEALKNQTLWLAIFSGVTAYAVMAFIMTATPLAMHGHGHDIQHAKWIIQSHVVAMYLPSLITPLIIKRIGLEKLIYTGAFVMLACITIALIDHSVIHYWWALVLLGIGWNFLYVSGTTLLAKTYQQGHAYKIQAINDSSITAFQSIGSLGAGAVLITFGWTSMLLASIFPVLLLLLLNIHHRQKMRTLSS
ncbi:MFS transporter [Vibrio sp.]|nr:MFS transporter [Vibrio sp.]